MIIDKLENISLYKNIPQQAALFIKNLSNDIAYGRQELTDTDYANIETYTTKSLNNAKFEAHKNYIDIQILLSGKEDIYYRDVSGMIEFEPYNENKDIVFFKENLEGNNYVTLDSTNFVMIFPHEAHAPQVAYENSPQQVKKVVVKIRI